MSQFTLQAEIDESPVGPVFGQGKISCHSSQEVTYSLQLALMEWGREARNSQASS